MKRVELRISSLILGLLAVVAIVCSQLFNFQVSTTSKKEVKTEQKENHSTSGEEQAYISLPSSNLPSSAHVELNRDVFFLFEILLDEDESEERSVHIALPLTKFFKTLLGATISPNAP